MNYLKQKIRTIPDFPAPRILFRDITTLLADPGAFNDVIERFVEHYQSEPLESPNFHSCQF
jgi:adenine phosphoribosyltransferase